MAQMGDHSKIEATGSTLKSDPNDTNGPKPKRDWVSASVSAAIVAGVVSVVVAATTAIVTLHVANQQTAADLRKIVIEQEQANKRPFLSEQLDLAFKATDAAAELATDTDPALWEKARLTFWRLYWGQLGIVEDAAVEAAMVKLGTIVPIEPVNAANLPTNRATIKGGAIDLAHAVRGLMQESWDVPLPPLYGLREPPPGQR